MGQLILFMMVTLDGYYEGPQGNIDWHHVDEEFNAIADEQLGSADALLFGRVTYQLMASYWPTVAARTNDPVIAAQMNRLPKYVFSRTLEKVEWNNTTLLGQDLAHEVSNIKERNTRNLLLFGSSNLAASLADLGLIDEYRIMVNPVALGDGKSLFKGLSHPLDLKLVNSKVFHNGNVLLYYRPATKQLVVQKS